MLRIWGRASSSNVQAVMWCIGELGLAYDRMDVGHSYGGNDTAEFLAMNPNGTVPVLRDGDDPPIWESGAILRYIASRYGHPAFWPVEETARANVDKWAEWAKINVAIGFTRPVFWQVVRTAPALRDPQVIRSGVLSLNRYLNIAEKQLSEQSHLARSDLSLADIQFGHVLYRYYDIDIDIERADFPNLRRYYDRLIRRPAYKEHVMVSYDELRVNDGKPRDTERSSN